MARIEILNRELYLNRARKRLEWIKQVRTDLDIQYEKRWRKRIWPFADRPETETPPPDDFFDYPSTRGWEHEQMLLRIIRLLTSENTGTIHLDSDEFFLVSYD